MILVAYRHGLRVSEVVDRWEQWTSEPPPCTSPPARIRSWGTNYAPCAGSSASRTPGRRSCSRRSAARRLPQAGKVATLAFKAHPHMLRHACGYAGAASQPWTPQYPAYSALYRAVADALQELLAGVVILIFGLELRSRLKASVSAARIPHLHRPGRGALRSRRRARAPPFF
jgi:hypothetical protein